MSRRIAVVRQMEDADCGAACLAMVLGYFGKRVDLRELRDRTGACRDGVTALSVVNAARSYGLRARGVKAEVTELRHLPRGSTCTGSSTISWCSRASRAVGSGSPTRPGGGGSCRTANCAAPTPAWPSSASPRTTSTGPAAAAMAPGATCGRCCASRRTWSGSSPRRCSSGWPPSRSRCSPRSWSTSCPARGPSPAARAHHRGHRGHRLQLPVGVRARQPAARAEDPARHGPDHGVRRPPGQTAVRLLPAQIGRRLDDAVAEQHGGARHPGHRHHVRRPGRQLREPVPDRAGRYQPRPGRRGARARARRNRHHGAVLAAQPAADVAKPAGPGEHRELRLRTAGRHRDAQGLECGAPGRRALERAVHRSGQRRPDPGPPDGRGRGGHEYPAGRRAAGHPHGGRLPGARRAPVARHHTERRRPGRRIPRPARHPGQQRPAPADAGQLHAAHQRRPGYPAGTAG